MPDDYDLSKPDEWGFERGLVAPKWGGFWSPPPIYSSPIWEGGGTPRDFSPHNHPATLTGITWTTSSAGVGWVLDSDGTTTNEVSIPNHAIWNATNELTLIVGVFPRDGTTAFQAIASRWDETSNNSRAWNIAYSGSSGDLRIDNGPSASFFGENTLVASNAFPLNKRSVLGISWGPTENKIYVDGINVATDTDITPGFHDSAIPVRLFRSALFAGGERGFDGQIDFFSLFNRVLPASLIAQISRDPFGPHTYFEDFGGFVPAAGAIPTISLVTAPYIPA